MNFRYWLLPQPMWPLFTQMGNKIPYTYVFYYHKTVFQVAKSWQNGPTMPHQNTLRQQHRDYFGYSNSQGVYAIGGVRLFGFILSPGEVLLQSWRSCKFPVTLGSHQRLCMQLPHAEGLNSLNGSILFSKEHRHGSWGTSHRLDCCIKPTIQIKDSNKYLQRAIHSTFYRGHSTTSAIYLRVRWIALWRCLFLTVGSKGSLMQLV